MQLKLLNAVKYNVESRRYESKGYKHKILWNLNKIWILVNNTTLHFNMWFFFYNIVFLYILRIGSEVWSFIQKTSF